MRAIDPQYISSLKTAETFGYKDVIYWPKQITEQNSNDNSTVKMFRSGCFNVASLGDVEDQLISARLALCPIFKTECDVMILAHHGAHNGFTNAKFLKTVRPTISVCSSNYGNQYDHPKQEIRDLLFDHKIPIFTTKTGDLVITSSGDHRHKYQVVNTKADTAEVSSISVYESKKSVKLDNNLDTIRNIYEKPRNPFSRFYR